MTIDINADLGEGGSNDAALMAIVSSANICCGAHAGDPETTRSTMELARIHGIVVGAHPGYPDREHFGRRELNWPGKKVGTEVLYQVGGLQVLARVVPVAVNHLKPHGALYNQACRDPELARTIAAVAMVTGLKLVGLPGSELEKAAKKIAVPFVAEGFADRRYRPDGSLVPRSEPEAFLRDPAEAVTQVKWLIQSKGVQTICIHGDNPEALQFAIAVRSGLETEGYRIQGLT